MNKHIYPIFKEKIKKMKHCQRCKDQISSHGNKKYCVTCSDIVFRERNLGYVRAKNLKKRYKISITCKNCKWLEKGDNTDLLIYKLAIHNVKKHGLPSGFVKITGYKDEIVRYIPRELN